MLLMSPVAPIFVKGKQSAELAVESESSFTFFFFAREAKSAKSDAPLPSRAPLNIDSPSNLIGQSTKEKKEECA